MAEFEGRDHGAAGDFVGGVHLAGGAVGEGVFDLGKGEERAENKGRGLGRER